MLGRSGLLVRKVLGNAVRNHGHGTTPGDNLPFDIYNAYKLTAIFALFFGSGFATPFLVVRHQMLKK